MEKKLIKLDELDDLRKGIGFHFTSVSNMDSILENGLRPTLGANSSGGLGKEANDKTFISLGLEGVLQLYNRLLLASFQGKIKDLQTDTHSSFIPDATRDRNPNTHLKVIEGFELVRQYMEDNVYFVFDVPVAKYEWNESIKENAIKDINSDIKKSNLYTKIKEIDNVREILLYSSSEKNIVDIIHDLETEEQNKLQIKRDIIDRLFELRDKSKKDVLKELTIERANLSNKVRDNTLRKIIEKRGCVIDSDGKPIDGKYEYGDDENPIIEEVDFNEDRLKWVDQIANPHNVHTRLIKSENKLKGVQIDKTMVKLYSKEGLKPSNGIEFLKDIFPKVNSNDKLAVKGDKEILEKFLEYVSLVDLYKTEGKLYKKPEHIVGERVYKERDCVDFSNLEKYEGLVEFARELEDTYNSKKAPYNIKLLALNGLKRDIGKESINYVDKEQHNRNKEVRDINE